MTSSPLSRVNPLVKIAACAIWTTAAVIFRQPEPLCVLAAASLMLVLFTPVLRHPRRLMLALLGLSMVGGIHLLIGGSLRESVTSLLRLVSLTGITAALMLSTDPADLLRSLRSLPLPRSVLLGLTLVWRSLPLLKRELDAILLACRLEGVRPSPLKPASLIQHVFVPLAFSMACFADEVSLSLETRGIDLCRKKNCIRRQATLFPDMVFSLIMVFLLIAAGGVQAWS
ncbi:energy-coupling factor transporter transmembrane component T family protein [Salidesulfovibrio brasiliensis]|uniref:energy-coupling factor transporter transmembrane component T family protein n=1 Tax=Salidesulfovibrio brasiliensis TaxID=221711 RepID=UPI0006D1EC46|nr:energy-coupling factor transporter transmembrane component T [Salidesulfovibrio brasiliensis]